MVNVVNSLTTYRLLSESCIKPRVPIVCVHGFLGMNSIFLPLRVNLMKESKYAPYYDIMGTRWDTSMDIDEAGRCLVRQLLDKRQHFHEFIKYLSKQSVMDTEYYLAPENKSNIFRFITHSTGVLIARSMLCQDEFLKQLHKSGIKKVHLIAIAPAHNGSSLARLMFHKIPKPIQEYYSRQSSSSLGELLCENENYYNDKWGPAILNRHCQDYGLELYIHNIENYIDFPFFSEPNDGILMQRDMQLMLEQDVDLYSNIEDFQRTHVHAFHYSVMFKKKVIENVLSEIHHFDSTHLIFPDRF